MGSVNTLGDVHKRHRKVGGGKGSKIGHNCRQIVLENCRRGEGGVKNPERLQTSFIDGSLSGEFSAARQNRNW